nr:hypothetical protein [Cladosporium ramotenellum polymycovirus 1]WEW73480.1 hypothetical protein [Cladosporium ramotenellum polymycovirus 1]
MAQNSPPLPFLRVARDIGKDRAYALIAEMSETVFLKMASQASGMVNARAVMAALSAGKILEGFEKFFEENFALPPIVDVNALADDETLAVAISASLTTPYRIAAKNWRDHPGHSEEAFIDNIFSGPSFKTLNESAVLLKGSGCAYAPKDGLLRPYRPDCCVQNLGRLPSDLERGSCGGSLPLIEAEYHGAKTFIVFAGGTCVTISSDVFDAVFAAKAAHVAPPLPGVAYGMVNFTTSTLRRVVKSKWHCAMNRRPPQTYPGGVREGVTTMMLRVTAEAAAGTYLGSFPPGLPEWSHLSQMRENLHRRA